MDLGFLIYAPNKSLKNVLGSYFLFGCLRPVPVP
jgi:hypothetical protein